MEGQTEKAIIKKILQEELTLHGISVKGSTGFYSRLVSSGFPDCNLSQQGVERYSQHVRDRLNNELQVAVMNVLTTLTEDLGDYCIQRKNGVSNSYSRKYIDMTHRRLSPLLRNLTNYLKEEYGTGITLVYEPHQTVFMGGGMLDISQTLVLGTEKSEEYVVMLEQYKGVLEDKIWRGYIWEGPGGLTYFYNESLEHLDGLLTGKIAYKDYVKESFSSYMYRKEVHRQSQLRAEPPVITLKRLERAYESVREYQQEVGRHYTPSVGVLHRGPATTVSSSIYPSLNLTVGTEGLTSYTIRIFTNFVIVFRDGTIQYSQSKQESNRLFAEKVVKELGTIGVSKEVQKVVYVGIRGLVLR